MLLYRSDREFFSCEVRQRQVGDGFFLASVVMADGHADA